MLRIKENTKIQSNVGYFYPLFFDKFKDLIRHLIKG